MSARNLPNHSDQKVLKVPMEGNYDDWQAALHASPVQLSGLSAGHKIIQIAS